jgi:hypothetical protein
MSTPGTLGGVPGAGSSPEGGRGGVAAPLRVVLVPATHGPPRLPPPVPGDDPEAIKPTGRVCTPSVQTLPFNRLAPRILSGVHSSQPPTPRC